MTINDKKTFSLIQTTLKQGLETMQKEKILPKVDYTNPTEMKLRKQLNLK